jgi:hypothetical protein
MNEDRQGVAWGRLIAGLIAGVIVGLAYGWLVNPVNYVDIAPQQLQSVYKEQYVLLVSQAYLADLDLGRARRRLAAMGVQDGASMVSQQADQAFARGASPGAIRALTVLAEALGGHPQAAEVFSGTANAPRGERLSPTPTFEAIATPTASGTPLPPLPPVPTPTETPVLIPTDATMKLVAIQTLCQSDHPAGRLEVFVLDVSGGGIPAVKVVVAWDGGTDTFFTGLKPEVSPGYADFQMEADRTYSITLVGLAEPVVGISSASCTTDTEVVQLPTYQLTFAPVTNP